MNPNMEEKHSSEGEDTNKMGGFKDTLPSYKNGKEQMEKKKKQGSEYGVLIRKDDQIW